jgi:hypothetical protein
MKRQTEIKRERESRRRRRRKEDSSKLHKSDNFSFFLFKLTRFIGTIGGVEAKH